MNLKKFKFREFIKLIENHPWIIFITATAIIFFLFRNSFGSYFEADEWFHFTYYLPLTRQPGGFLTALVSTVINSGPLSGGQHVSPIATVIFFLNTKFFGISFPPYAFMTLLFHATNSFLVFLLIRILLYKKDSLTKNIFGILSSVFFALAPAQIHTVTGAAAFYSYNVLSVTFFLLCILFFKLAFFKKIKKYIYFSIIFLFLALFTKETAVFLFLLLPFMVFLEKRIFPLKFLGKLFIVCIIAYAIFRFVLPNINQGVRSLVDKLIGSYISSSLPSWQQTAQQPSPQDTGTIVSRDLSIHKNLPGEIMFRSITFPIKMTGTLFLPRQTVFSIVQFITPIVQPVPPGGDSADSSQARLTFLYGPGNGFIIYIASLVILIFCAGQIFRFVRRRQIQEAQTLAIGLAIIVLSSMPLVAIIFSFPRWGYDFYFDSRHYYNPNVGAAIVFPFLFFGLAKFVSKRFRIRKVSFAVFAVFIIWLINNMNSFGLGVKQFTQNFQPDRREVVRQLKEYLPSLPKNVVFYIETDGLSAYGPILPFQTSVPQALTVVYYHKNPLPDSFFDKPIFDGKGEGYLNSHGRGFGYYRSKKTLSEALLANQFKTSDIYAFYYKAKDVQLLDITDEVRSEMEEYLGETKENLDWKVYIDQESGFSFSYPPQTIVSKKQETVKTFILDNPDFQALISVFNISPGFNLNEFLTIGTNGKFDIANSKKVSYDTFHYNDASVIIDELKNEYFIRLDNHLIHLKTQNTNEKHLLFIEKILGSTELAE